jgi:ABC-2 type transport system permease protein
MSAVRIFALARVQLRIVLADPTPATVLIALPLLLIAFVVRAVGVEQAIAGMAVMFSFFILGWQGLGFFLEHSWKTWDRVRASGARAPELLIGKLIPYLAVGALQLSVLLFAGWLLFELRIQGDIIGLLGLSACLHICILSLGVLLVAYCSSVEQHGALSNLISILLGGLGGAIAPVLTLPDWAQSMARVTPTYWAIEGLRAVLSGPVSAVELLPHMGILIGFALIFSTLAVLRFRIEETKTSW